jgi:hypothetical protein
MNISIIPSQVILINNYKMALKFLKRFILSGFLLPASADYCTSNMSCYDPTAGTNAK